MGALCTGRAGADPGGGADTAAEADQGYSRQILGWRRLAWCPTLRLPRPVVLRLYAAVHCAATTPPETLMHSTLILRAALPLLAALHPATLRCEYARSPLGIDIARPELGWQLRSAARDQFQSAYQVLAATSPARLTPDRADLWNSGRVVSGQSQHLEYLGKALLSRQRVWWTVRVWNQHGRRSAFAKEAWWEMGLLRRQDWRASWIALPPSTPPDQGGPCPFFRREFTLPSIVSARAYVTARGLYQLYINGHPVGNAIFPPGFTDYHKRILYQTYDITRLLRSGRNVVGLVLGDGWYCGHVGWGGRHNYGPYPEGLLQLQVRTLRGSTVTVATGRGWTASFGPILSSDLYMGEDYDARKEMPGWSTPGFDATGWRAVRCSPLVCAVAEEADSSGGRAVYSAGARALASTTSLLARNCKTEGAGVSQSAAVAHLAGLEGGLLHLQAQWAPPAQRVATVWPVARWTTSSGATIFDLGQNLAGRASVELDGPAGQQVTLRYAEMLNPDRTLYTANLRKARATDTYTLRGSTGGEAYEPAFTFHGFRYVELSGYSGPIGSRTLRAVVISSAVRRTGSFACSSRLINQIQHNIWWSEQANYLCIPTDCPQRDERLGWMGDAEVFAPTACFNADAMQFLGKWTHDVQDAQSAEGGFSDVSPRVLDIADGAPAWGDAGVIVPWVLARQYGDLRILGQRYGSMARWLNYIRKANPGGIWRNRLNNNFGDWLNVNDPTPPDLLATAYYARDAHIMARAASLLGRAQEAASYGSLWQEIRAAFDRAYVNPQTGELKGGSETAYALALGFDLAPQALRLRIGGRLAQDIEQKHEGHLTTGFVGTACLLEALSSTGHLDLAYRLLESTTYPSWGFEIIHGATTIWERWDGWTPNKGFQDAGMNSFNHYAFGAVGHWMYSRIGGIRPDPARGDYQHVLFEPRPGGGITWSRETFQSLYGPVRCSWRADHGKLHVSVAIPANCSAVLVLPTRDASGVRESGRRLAGDPGVRRAYSLEGGVHVELGSGDYDFEAATAALPLQQGFSRPAAAQPGLPRRRPAQAE